MYLVMTLVLSVMLQFWLYVWQLDPRHAYDEHQVLALKLDVTHRYNSATMRRLKHFSTTRPLRALRDRFGSMESKLDIPH
jgi:hypothetical protein